jgi:hypothetical protein
MPWKGLTMPNVDYQWVREQLQENKTRVGVGNTVLELLAAWEKGKHTEKQNEEVIELFSKLAQNIPLKQSNADETWVQAQPGQIAVSDVVRVKFDAFKDDTGRMHNGRQGKVVAVRYGDVIFKSTDGKMPLLDGVHYSPYNLEKRIK